MSLSNPSFILLYRVVQIFAVHAATACASAEHVVSVVTSWFLLSQEYE